MSVIIGQRWKPGHVIKRDDERGMFCEVNSPIYTSAELDVQRALLSPVRFKFVEQRIAQAQAAKRAHNAQKE